MRQKFVLKIFGEPHSYSWELRLGNHCVAQSSWYYSRKSNALRAFKTMKARLHICEGFDVEEI